MRRMRTVSIEPIVTVAKSEYVIVVTSVWSDFVHDPRVAHILVCLSRGRLVYLVIAPRLGPT